MATVVLTAVGTALGGPFGGAIGGLIGNAVDHGILFKPKGREGPRLSDLQVQTSSYGTQVPKLFGTIRVAGTVIWATDLKESKTRSGGKGRPSVTSYSYSASFAVALSARTIRRVGRIWADGNLLRGAAGDFKTELGAFRLHGGAEGQAVDPLIASAQGTSQTPAHRGIAYAVFENLALADYGNRIPSLTFEVEADDGAVAIDAIAAELSEGRLGGEGPGSGALATLGGYAAEGGDLRAAIAPLVAAHGLALGSGEAGLALLPAPDVAEEDVTAAIWRGGSTAGRSTPWSDRPAARMRCPSPCRCAITTRRAIIRQACSGWSGQARGARRRESTCPPCWPRTRRAPWPRRAWRRCGPDGRW
ncbi:hypothetical protein J3E64_000374 [Sphingobium sp. OAS761]|nr:hypothetical protein [Sphingobium sp. OAS761]